MTMAQRDYASSKKKVFALINLLQEQLANEQVRFDSEPNNYGFLGNMGRRVELLMELTHTENLTELPDL